MLTLQTATESYKIVTKTTCAPSGLFLYRTLDNICAVERLCVKIAKTVLKANGYERTVLRLKSSQAGWIQDNRILNSALHALRFIYGDVDLVREGDSVTIFWKSKHLPQVNAQDHLNCKLFQAILANRSKEVKWRVRTPVKATPRELGKIERALQSRAPLSKENRTFSNPKGIADPNAIGPFELRPLQAILNNFTIERALVNYGARRSYS